jgi:hypothetical protein
MRIRILLPIIIAFLIAGCNSPTLPDLTKQELATICGVDSSQMEVIRQGTAAEYKLHTSGMSTQSVWIEVGPYSKKHFSDVRQIQKDQDLNHYPDLGEEAVVWTKQHIFRTMLLSDGDQAYRIRSIIDGCDDDEGLIAIANAILDS